MVYVIHFERPLHHARHYVGLVASRERLGCRLQEHRSGRGAKILDACNRARIPYRVVRTLNGGRLRERKVKNCKNTPKYCPACNPQGWRNHN